MKTNIYTIPVIDAFKADDECPFCFIERQLEQEAISFILGPAYMEADIREDTDKLGFCRHHHQMMYAYGNQLGVALMLDTYYQKMTKELKSQLQSFSPQKSSMLKRLKTSEIHDKAQTSIGQWIEAKESTCYVCNIFNQNIRATSTLFYSWLLRITTFLSCSKIQKASAFTILKILSKWPKISCQTVRKSFSTLSFSV